MRARLQLAAGALLVAGFGLTVWGVLSAGADAPRTWAGIALGVAGLAGTVLARAPRS